MKINEEIEKLELALKKAKAKAVENVKKNKILIFDNLIDAVSKNQDLKKDFIVLLSKYNLNNLKEEIENIYPSIKEDDKIIPNQNENTNSNDLSTHTQIN